jgi:hypothetical protein
VELLAGVPVLLLAGLIALQLLATGYAQSVADGAAEAGAVALTAGSDPDAAVDSALPGWATGRAGVTVTGGAVTVEVRPPSPLPALGDALRVSSTAWVRPPS